ncbi:hypothetical protein BDZ89DRAFT_1168462 [Hymenopellis radicata]|nr:hypothetical protein BDZ89DRAFT_1168462 [Hymenopellis radicata]
MQNQMHELAKTLPPPRKQNTACDACRSRKVKCNRLPASTSPPSPNIVNNGSPTLDNGPTTHMPLISSVYRCSFYPPVTLDSSTQDVLVYLFSPPDTSNDRDPPSFTQHHRGSAYALWGEQAGKLEDDAFRAEFALDLVEVFFQIVHTRLPLLNPEQFRNSLRLHPSSTSAPGKHLHPALVATVISWGAKFSEHPLLVADRDHNAGQSHLAKTLIDRTREIAEALRVHRIPKDEHVVIGLLIEPLQAQTPDDQTGYHGFWLASATRHLLDLGINHKSVISSTSRDPEDRGTMIFAWWMACICDAYSSLYYRHKPILDDDDYDIDFYTVDPISSEVLDGTTPSPREQLEFLGYYRAAHSLARTARQMSRSLWKPATDADGVPFEVLTHFSTALSEWRDQYLQVVGVPSNENGSWDFVTAVSSCASDAQYHVMWIILFNALDEYGVKEINEAMRIGASQSSIANYTAMEGAKRKLADEALHGALRISALAGVLTTNQYLRLDPAVMHVSCIQAGTLLARMGRPEVKNCIDGLEQYSSSYAEAGEHATEIRRIYHSRDAEFNHMKSVASRPGMDMSSGAASSPVSAHSGAEVEDMVIDEP